MSRVPQYAVRVQGRPWTRPGRDLAPKTVQGTIFIDSGSFWVDFERILDHFGWIFHDFSMIYATFWAEFKHQFLKLLSKKHINHNPASQQNTKPTNHKPQPHKPTNHFPKTLARRNARKRSAAPPWGVPGVLDFNTKFLSVFARSQISKPQIPGSRCRAQDPCQTRRGFNPSLPPRRPRTFRWADPFYQS